MQRRKFLQAAGMPVLGLLTLKLLGCSENHSSLKDDGSNVAPPAAEGETVSMRNIKAYAYFQAFSPGVPNQTIDVSDGGTETGIVSTDMILANKPVTIMFWHHHNPDNPHRFTVTPDHFAQLKQGKSVNISTTVDDGHYHVAKIDPKRVDPNSPEVKIPVTIEITEASNPA